MCDGVRVEDWLSPEWDATCPRPPVVQRARPRFARSGTCLGTREALWGVRGGEGKKRGGGGGGGGGGSCQSVLPLFADQYVWESVVCYLAGYLNVTTTVLHSHGSHTHTDTHTHTHTHSHRAWNVYLVVGSVNERAGEIGERERVCVCVCVCDLPPG